jgi:integrase
MNNCRNRSPKRRKSARRPNYEGTIWQQYGYFYGKIRYKGVLYRVGGYKSRARAESALRRKTEEITRIRDDKTTLAEWSEEWLQAILLKTDRNTTHNTYRNYKNAVGHACRHIGYMKMSEIRPCDLTRLYVNLSSEGYSAATVSLVAATMKALSRYAVVSDRILKDFTMGAIKPKAEKRKYRVFTKIETMRFLSLIEKERLKFPMLFMLMLGARRGEAMAIKWDRIDLDNKTVLIDSQAVSEGGARVVKKPKTESSVRRIIMPDYLVKELQTVPKRQRKTYTYNFTRLRPEALSRDFRRIAKQMGIPGMRLYDLRHTFASVTIYEGTSAKEVADQLGHSSDKIVNNVYVHKAPNQGSMCSKVMDAFVADPTPCSAS